VSLGLLWKIEGSEGEKGLFRVGGGRNGGRWDGRWAGEFLWSPAATVTALKQLGAEVAADRPREEKGERLIIGSRRGFVW
jgi:hypothetical protein